MPDTLIFIKKIISILAYLITIANIIASSKERPHSILRRLIITRIVLFTVIDDRKENKMNIYMEDAFSPLNLLVQFERF